MYFEQLGKNLWKCVGDAPRHPVTGKRKQISRRGKTKGEARKKVEDEIEKLKTAYEFSSKITVATFAERFMEQYRMRGNKETTNIYREYCLSILCKYIGNMKVTSVTSKMLQDVMNDTFHNNVANNTLKGLNSTINQLFKYAVDTNLIVTSPATSVFVPRKQEQLVEDVEQQVKQLYLEADELKRLLTRMDKHRNVILRTIAYVIAFTGMRPGEAIALKYSDISYEKKAIYVSKTAFKQRRHETKLTPPKTANAIRIIDIDDIVIEKLKYLEEFKKEKDWVQTEFIFSDKNGVLATVDALNQFVKRAGANAKIPKRCRTYILRHTHISLLAEVGVDLTYIMNRVGHKNSETTTKIYLHVTEGMRNNASNLMHKRFTELLNTPEN